LGAFNNGRLENYPTTRQSEGQRSRCNVSYSAETLVAQQMFMAKIKSGPQGTAKPTAKILF
jgi:hypothetical protein